MLWFLFEGKRQLHIRWARCTKFTNIELRVTDIGLIWSSLRIPKYWGAEQANQFLTWTKVARSCVPDNIIINYRKLIIGSRTGGLDNTVR